MATTRDTMEPNETDETSQVFDKCALHEDKLMEIYCHTCRKTMCLSCMFANHRTHDCAELEMVNSR